MNRSLTLHFGVFLFLLLGVLPLQAVTPAEAIPLDGKAATVDGAVSDVNITTRGHAFVNMGGVYPDHTFTAYIPAVIVPLLGREYLEGLRGRTISVTGKIKVYKGKPEIVVTKKDQIVIETAKAAPAPVSPPEVKRGL